MSLLLSANFYLGLLVQGGIFALVGVSFVVLFKATKVLSFVQGALMVLGAFLLAAFRAAGFALVPASLAAALCVSAAGASAYVLLFRRADKRTPFTVAIATIGLGNALLAIWEMIWGTGTKVVTTSATQTWFIVGSARVSSLDVTIVVLAIAASGALVWFMSHTRLGLDMRAVADSPYVAEYVGVNVSRVALIAWSLAGLFAGIAGCLLAAQRGADPTTISSLGLLVFPAIIIGGLDSLAGAVAGGFILSAIYSIVGAYLGGSYQGPVLYAVLLFFIALRPHGLLGSRAIDRV